MKAGLWRILILFAALVVARPAHAGPFDQCDFTVETTDGRYGFVWKPSGAHRPQAVLVLPGRFKGFLAGSHTLTVRSVTMYSASDLKKIGDLPMKSNGICKPGGECLDRPSFAHPSLSGKAISRRYGPVRLRIVSNVGKHVHCTKAFDPANRQD